MTPLEMLHAPTTIKTMLVSEMTDTLAEHGYNVKLTTRDGYVWVTVMRQGRNDSQFHLSDCRVEPFEIACLIDKVCAIHDRTS